MLSELKEKNWKTIIGSIVFSIICFILVEWVIPEIKDNGIVSFLTSITSTVAAAFLVNVLWELFAKKGFAELIYQITQISQNIEKSGIDNVDMDFSCIDWKHELCSTQNFTAVFTYARTWRNSNNATLKEYAKKVNKRRGNRVRGSFTIIMPDYENDRIMEEFDRRFQYDSGKTKSLIQESAKEYNELGAKVFLFDGSLHASYYLLDNVGFMSFFNHAKEKNTVPVIRAENKGTFYEYISTEVDNIRKNAVRVTFDKQTGELIKGTKK